MGSSSRSARGCWRAQATNSSAAVRPTLAGVQGNRTLRLKGVDDDDEEVEEFGFSYTLLAEEEPKQATKRSSLTGPPKGGVPKAPPATPKKAAPAAPAKGKKK